MEIIQQLPAAPPVAGIEVGPHRRQVSTLPLSNTPAFSCILALEQSELAFIAWSYFKLLRLLCASVSVQIESPSSGINPQSSFIGECRLLFHRCSETPDGNNSKKGFYYSWFQRTPFWQERHGGTAQFGLWLLGGEGRDGGREVEIYALKDPALCAASSCWAPPLTVPIIPQTSTTNCEPRIQNISLW